MAGIGSTSGSTVRRCVLIAGALLSGCTPTAVPSFEIPGTGTIVPAPDFAAAPFATTTEVSLRAGQEDDTRIIAVLPQGTPVVPAGVVGSECPCWKVATPAGTGWVYTRYLALRSYAEPE
jgi:uncharacterized protein YraI